MKNSKTGNSIAPWTLFLFYMAMFYMQYKGQEKAAKVVKFVSVYGTGNDRFSGKKLSGPVSPLKRLLPVLKSGLKFDLLESVA